METFFVDDSSPSWEKKNAFQNIMSVRIKWLSQRDI